jgi:hypothetical protein
MIKIVNSARNSKEDSFQLQRLAFGTVKRLQLQNPFIQQSQIEIIEAAEYAIERRAGVPISENRYFCSAPLSTAEHIRTLEEIEKVVASAK